MRQKQCELRYLVAAGGVATVMALAGCAVISTAKMSWFGIYAIAFLSNLIWVPLAFWFARRRKPLGLALFLGAISPYAAGLFLFPPWSWIVITEDAARVIPVGAATGGIIWLLARSKWSPGPTAA